MPCTWDRIVNGWLGGGKLAAAREDVVRTFDLVEKRLGSDWMEAARGAPGDTGPAPTLTVVSMGRRLMALHGVEGAEHLIEQIRMGDVSAEAELTALYLLRSPDLHVRLQPAVEGTTRVADFALRDRRGPEMYVEVTRLDHSDAFKAASQAAAQLAATLEGLPPGACAAEFYLSRAPTDQELLVLQEALTDHFAGRSPSEVPLPNDLGSLYLGFDEPGKIVLGSNGAPARPGIAVVKFAVTEGVTRHVTVRIAYTDERAAGKLDREAGQLPSGGPGLVMIETSGAPGANRTWPDLMKSRFPGQHTRVSGVVLFGAGLRRVQGGEDWVPQCVLIENPFASTILPDFVSANLSRWRNATK